MLSVLQVLSLSNNAVGNKTAAAFGDLLEENTTLTDLDLSWNQIKVGLRCMRCHFMVGHVVM